MKLSAEKPIGFFGFSAPFPSINDKPHLLSVYRLINHLGCWDGTREKLINHEAQPRTPKKLIPIRPARQENGCFIEFGKTRINKKLFRPQTICFCGHPIENKSILVAKELNQICYFIGHYLPRCFLRHITRRGLSRIDNKTQRAKYVYVQHIERCEKR